MSDSFNSYSCRPSGGKTQEPYPEGRADARQADMRPVEKLDRIKDQFERQIADWKTAFAQALAAFSFAINQRDTKLDEVKREYEKDAAVAALIFSVYRGTTIRHQTNRTLFYSFGPCGVRSILMPCVRVRRLKSLPQTA